MNAIVIAQTGAQARLAFDVHQNAAINQMRLARARVAAPPAGGARSPLSVAFTFRSKALQSSSDTLRVEVAFRMAGTEETPPEEGTKPPPAVLIECAFEVDYSLREGFSPSPEQVKAFKDGNAIFNAWPYFREYLQSTLQRMGLPALAAPFLRLQLKPDKKQSAPE